MLHSIEIGKKITLYRKSLRMSEGLLAKLLGVSTQAVSKWESGASMPDTINLTMLSEIFSVKIETLLGYKCDKVIKEIKPRLYEENNYSIITHNHENNVNLRKSIESKKMENLILLNYVSNNFVARKLTTKHCVFSKATFNNTNSSYAKNINVLYIDNTYRNFNDGHSVMDHCVGKLNKISGNISYAKYVYCITVGECWENVKTSNCKISFSSHTNLTCVNTTTLDSTWNGCIIYDAVFIKSTFLRLEIINCHFKKCTFIDCVFDKQTYHFFNTKENKMIRTKIVD